MSWLSEFLHSPLDYIQEEPLKALSLIGAPVAAIAAPFAFPAIGSALGIGAGAAGGLGAGLGAAGAGAEAAGAGGLFSSLFGGAEAAGLGSLGSLFGGAEAAGAGLGAELGGLGLTGGEFAGLSGGATDFLGGLGITGDMLGADALGAYAADTAGAVGGISTDVSMAGAPLAGTTDALAYAPSAAEPGFLESLWGGAKSSLFKNPLGVAAAGAGLGMNIMRGQQTSPEMDALSKNAAALGAQGSEMMKYLQSGTLPPGMQQAVNNATHAMKARIVANHAKNGMSTDPAQNSALAQELNSVDLNAVALIAQKGQELLNSGMNMTNMSTQLYGLLEKLNRDQSAQMGQAIASFAAALSGPQLRISRA